MWRDLVRAPGRYLTDDDAPRGTDAHRDCHASGSARRRTPGRERRSHTHERRRLRRTLRDWLLPVLDDDPDAADDLVLAVGEALENAADHAFTGPGPVGSMCVRATDHGRRISIVVSDDGRWRPPDTDPGCRGRGIELMNHLADVTRIEATTVGTAVTLEHHRRLRPAA